MDDARLTACFDAVRSLGLGARQPLSPTFEMQLLHLGRRLCGEMAAGSHSALSSSSARGEITCAGSAGRSSATGTAAATTSSNSASTLRWVYSACAFNRA